MAKRKRFPDEAPVFEVLGSFYRGEVVEGIEIGCLEFAADIEFRFLGTKRSVFGGETDGYHYSQMKPLTPAARAMLAIARERAS